MDTQWYKLDTSAVLNKLSSNLNLGLSKTEAEARREQFGLNELVDRGMKSPWKILLEQLTGILVIILIISAGISLYLGEYPDAVAILVIVILNTLLGFTQEYRAEKAMAALKRMTTPLVRVRRDGHLQEISSRELVPGDIIQLEAGNSVPADSRLIESINLRAQEAVLTGESNPVEKTPPAIEKDNVAIGDRLNMVFMGTAISYGRGSAVVVETGMRTELGRIAEMIQSVDQEKTPLQKRLDQLGKGLAIAAFFIVIGVFVFGLLRGENLRLMFMTSISLAVAAVPEGLPAVVTIALAMGAQRMLKRNALIRKLPAVETLGSVTVICSDKTGTLTENRMTVTILDVAGSRLDVHRKSPSEELDNEPPSNWLESPTVGLLLAASALCNDATLEPSADGTYSGKIIGDPTEGALLVTALSTGLLKEDLDNAFPRIAELPFDSERKRMTTIHQIPTGDRPLPESYRELIKPIRMGKDDLPFVAFTKGAVEGLLQISNWVLMKDRLENLDESWRQRILKANSEMAQNGMRVLGAAYRLRSTPNTKDQQDVLESQLIFIGMVGMIDPARPEVKASIQTAKTAGIRTIMITGDHPQTALAIARNLGIIENSQPNITQTAVGDGLSTPNAALVYPDVITGQELAEMSLTDLDTQVEKVSVYARVAPEHKLKIVEALQKKGHVVAMTGDGVNDAPALKKANIGVAMGITGTDVSKEASDTVLLDDNFATIVAAVEEGRQIYDNIRRFVKYALASNTGEIWVMLAAPFLGLPLPLSPLQILWVNLVTDGLPGLALTMEPPERNTMQRPPFSTKESFLGRGMGIDILWIGILMGLLCLGIGLWGFLAGSPAWQTMVFTVLTLSQMGNVMAIRSDHDSLVSIGLFSNKAMTGAVLITILLQFGVIYVPFLQNIFQTVALNPLELVVCIITSLIPFLCIEGVKHIRKQKKG